MNRRQKLNRQRRTLFPSAVKPRLPYWWPTKKDLEDPAYDEAVKELTRSEDEHVVNTLRLRMTHDNTKGIR